MWKVYISVRIKLSCGNACPNMTSIMPMPFSKSMDVILSIVIIQFIYELPALPYTMPFGNRNALYTIKAIIIFSKAIFIAH